MNRDLWSEQFPLNYWIKSVIDEASSVAKDEALYCDIHPHNKFNLYCDDHEAICCAMCVATCHRKCDNVEEISKLLDSDNSGQVQNEVLEKLKQSEDILTDLDAKCALAESNLQIDRDKMTNTIDAEYNEAIAHLDALKQTAVDKVEQNCRLITTEIMTRKVVCNKGKLTCRQVKDILTETDKGKAPFSLFIQSHAARLKMKSVDVCAANLWSFNEADSLKFEVDQQFTRIKALQNLGNVKDTRIVDTESIRADHRSTAQNNTESRDAGKREPRGTSNAPANMSRTGISVSPETSDMTPTPIGICTELRYIKHWNNTLLNKHWISGSTFLHHGLLLLCNQSDHALCLVRESSFLYEDKRRTPPWDITKISDSSIVATYPQENIMRVFEIKCNGAVLKLFGRPSIRRRPVTFSRSIYTQEPCFGIVAVLDRVYVACEDCIKVYTLSGRCAQVLKLSLRVEPLFERVIGLAYDSQHSILYATDEVGNSLFSFRITEKQLSHEPIFVYKDSVMRRPHGIAVGLHRDIYVCGFISKTIHIITTDGTCMRILSTEQRPCGICIDTKQCLLVISFYPDYEQGHANTSDDVRFYRIQGHT